jgi:hypothetical protein
LAAGFGDSIGAGELMSAVGRTAVKFSFVHGHKVIFRKILKKEAVSSSQSPRRSFGYSAFSARLAAPIPNPLSRIDPVETSRVSADGSRRFLETRPVFEPSR